MLNIIILAKKIIIMKKKHLIIVLSLIFVPVIYLIIWNYNKYNNTDINNDISNVNISIKQDNRSENTNQNSNPPNQTTEVTDEELRDAIALTETKPTEDNYITLSVKYYCKKMYKECIQASEKVLEINPKNATAYNNICTAHNALSQWDLAKAACQKAIELQPDFDLAKNNLKIAEAGSK